MQNHEKLLTWWEEFKTDVKKNKADMKTIWNKSKYGHHCSLGEVGKQKIK